MAGYSLAIKSDGTLWAWGGNAAGQLGLDDTTDRVSPAQVGSGAWSSAIAGTTSSFAMAPLPVFWQNFFGQYEAP